MNFRKFTAAVLSCVMVLSLAACRRGPSETKAPATAPTEAVTQAVTKAPATAAAPETTKAPETTAAPEPEKQSVQPVHVILETVDQGIVDSSDPYVYRKKAEDQYVRIMLTPEDAEKYPELQAGLMDYNRMLDEGHEETLSDLADVYAEVFSSVGEEYMADMYATNETTGTVVRADSNVVSVFLDNYQYWLGAHPDTMCGGASFDTESGKKLMFKDVVTDPEKFYDIVDEKLQEEYEDIYEQMVDFDDYRHDLDYEDYAFVSWTVDNEGVTVYFNPYELGSYAMGAQFIKVFFDEAPGAFNEKYTETLPSYVIPIKSDTPVKIDVNGDGKREDVTLTYESPEGEEWYYIWKISDGRRSVKINDWGYSEHSYIICRDGHYYAYIFETSDNDYTMLRVIDLETMDYDPDYIPNASLIRYDSQYEERPDGYWSSDSLIAFTDADCFRMSTRIDVLGTKSGWKTYHAGENGCPESDENSFILDTGVILKALQPLECSLVDEAGNVTGDAVIAEGTYLFFVRSDGENYADLQEIDKKLVTEEGDEYYSYMYSEEIPDPDFDKEVYRVVVTHGGWPNLINGVPEDDVFAGINYAG